MHRTSAPRFEVATLTDQGARAHQQDALVANFATGEEIGLCVLADGMGGHCGGDVASALVVGRAFAEIRAGLALGVPDVARIEAVLRDAVEVANEAVRDRIAADPGLRGMGSTLVACVTVGPALHWVSVGDSPLYLWREGALRQLNEDHSMKPRIAVMAASGLIDPELAANHPDRNQLLSAICGRRIGRVDCHAEPFALRRGDVLIAASDGLQTLPDAEIARILRRHRSADATTIAETLMRGVEDADLPDQDNVAIMALRVVCDRPVRVSEPFEPTIVPEEPIPFDAVPLEDAGPPPAGRSDEGIERASDDILKALAL
jgi:serine/threonine protein phosphatase PrpC